MLHLEFVHQQVRKVEEVNELDLWGFTWLIPFWHPFLTSDYPVGRDLQNHLTSGGQKIKSLKTSYVRYQIIGFFGDLIPFLYPFLTCFYPFWMHKKIYLHWFYFLTSRGKQILEVMTFRIIWCYDLCVSKKCENISD